ncbi:MAG: 50S ribosomal protein L25/general stress protein Ctc, partial [Bacteroidia bacterium]|nr:50S ribosomal protein L25/general stress protein Ctc [Bacteroidia bacterium]
MKSIEISGNARANINKASNRELRAQDQVPCVLYGGSENVHFQSHELNFRKLIYTPDAHIVNLDVDGNKFNAVLQEVQFHPITDKILHIDFLELQDDKPVKISVPVKLIGASEGVKQGGKLTLKMRKIQIKALPGDLPDAIEVNIEPLEIGDSFRINELNLPG